MTVTAAVLTPRPGQGSTAWAIALAWEASESAPVLLIDADPQGGTVADYLGLDLGAGGGGPSMARLFGPPEVSASAIEANAVPVPARPNLRVVPGLSGFCGPSMQSFLPKLSPRDGSDVHAPDVIRRRAPNVLTQVTAEVVIVDLGAPLAHPDLQSAERVAEAISAAFQRVFVVIRDSPGLLAHNLTVLRAAHLARGEVILIGGAGRAGAGRDMRRVVGDALAHSVPETALGAEWAWRPDAAQAAEQSGRAMPAPGLARALHLL